MSPTTSRTQSRAAAQDLFFGQVVTLWARWFVILGSALLALWSADTAGELALNVAVIVSLMGVNFFLHGRYLAERPANAAMTMLVSLFDLAAITTVVMTWHGQTGLDSRYVVFYYPVVFAFALVFAPRLALSFTGLAVGLYTFACLTLDPAILSTGADLKQLVMRAITIAAMGGLGAYFWRIQRAPQRQGATQPLTARHSHAA